MENISADRILDFIEAIASGCADSATIAAYVYKKAPSQLQGAEKGHVTRAGGMAEMLGFVKSNDEGHWFLADPGSIDLERWDEAHKRVLFRDHLQRFQPFLWFWDFVRRGMSSNDAAIRASVVLGLEPPVTGDKNVLASWGEFTGIFIREDGKLGLAEAPEIADIEEHVRVLRGLEQALSNNLAARAWLENLLGREAFDATDPQIVDDLVRALVDYRDNPDAAIRETGKALEDYLKFVAQSRGISLFDKKGRPIDQLSRIAQLLRSERVIANKHVNVLRGLETFLEYDVLEGLAAFRNMPSHGRDVEDWERWNLGDEIALCVILETVLAIRSLYFYTVKNKRYF